MKPQTVTVLVCLLGASLSLPLYQQQIGILASNSNEILRLNGLTLTGVGFGQTQMQYVIQQQPELGLPQMVNFNPQVGGPFGPQMMFPTQGNQLPPILYANAQQEQPGAPQDPNNPNNPQQPHNPAQGVPQFPQYYPSFSFPQQPRMQGYPYYMSYGYPNYPQPNQNNGQNQLNLEKTPQKPQLPLQQAAQPQAPGKTWPKGFQTEAANPPPDHRGDTVDPGVDEGHPNFSFLFEP
ncbi:uncharacterized protein [Oncorhynchus clarkii lewisi]|uniref:uncharacterized protein isoform X2 n=1 Tax=Oncorhynchus clarkii lewisi TaxID=490388 RepID=UPI0039B8B65F